jgi:hypothetical protein
MEAVGGQGVRRDRCSSPVVCVLVLELEHVPYSSRLWRSLVGPGSRRYLYSTAMLYSTAGT